MRHLFLRTLSLLSLLAAVACAPPAAVPLPPTADPQPTVLPAADLLARADQAARAGDAGYARELLATLLLVHPSGPAADQARLALAVSALSVGRPQQAEEVLAPIVAASDHPLFAPALFLRARSAAAAGDFSAARADYQAYAALNTPLVTYALLADADAAVQLADTAAAEAGYLQLGQADLAYLRRAAALESAFALQQARNDPAAAAATYRLILSFARTPDYRRTLLTTSADLSESAADDTAAAAAWNELIVEHPGALAAGAVDRLRARNVLPADLSAAVWAYVAADRAADAVAYADELLPSLSGESAQAVQRLRGLAQRALAEYDAALADLEAARVRDPQSDQGIQARLDTIQTIGQRGALLGAAQAYQAFAADLPADRRAPIALDRAIQLYSRLADSTAVAQTTVDLARNYPDAELSHAALHRLALTALQRGDTVAAHAYWRQSMQSAAGLTLARAAFWAGRTGQLLARADANADLALAISSAPTSYFAARAAALLDLPPAGTLSLDVGATALDWPALTAWVAGFAPPLSAADQAALVAVALRAAHLTQVGLADFAHDEWLEGLRRAENNPAALLRLAALAAAQSAVPVMIQAADRLAANAPTDNPPPADLARLRYPTPYADIVRGAAAAEDLDPRLFYALLRQESLFNPRAQSWAGARGLAQVMPETAAAIAADLRVTDFSVDDLFNPAVSIRFGTFYLSRRLTDMQGSPAGALAAYNGGLANAQRWAAGASVPDVDLFIETIDFPETRDYVQRVLAGYHQYQLLYDGR